MIELLAALALQTQTTLAMPDTCGERLDCALVLIEPGSADAFAIERDTENDQLEPYSQSLMSGASRAAWRWQVTGRINSGDEQSIELTFFTRSGACRETTDLYLLWPFLGYSETLNPVFETLAGELEITAEFPQVGAWDWIFLASLSPATPNQPLLSLTEYEELFFDSTDEIYALQLQTRCVRLPTENDQRIRAADMSKCTYRGEGDERSPFPLNTSDLEITFDDYWPFGVENLPDHALLSNRMPCT